MLLYPGITQRGTETRNLTRELPKISPFTTKSHCDLPSVPNNNDNDNDSLAKLPCMVKPQGYSVGFTTHPLKQ